MRAFITAVAAMVRTVCGIASVSQVPHDRPQSPGSQEYHTGTTRLTMPYHHTAIVKFTSPILSAMISDALMPM